MQERVEQAVRNRVEHARALEHIAEIEEVVQRIDFSWEQGFISPEAYLEKRAKLQQEIDALRPIDYDYLMEAADMLQNFGSYWRSSGDKLDPTEARKQLVAKIVDRIFVYNDHVIAIVLHGDFGIILDSGLAAPEKIVESLQTNMKKGRTLDKVRPQNENDGI